MGKDAGVNNTWHPASGQWGIFGDTSGHHTANEAGGLINQQIGRVQKRRGGIADYFKGLDELTKDMFALDRFDAEQARHTLALQQDELKGEQKKIALEKEGIEDSKNTALAQFINESYKIPMESDVKESTRGNLVSASDKFLSNLDESTRTAKMDETMNTYGRQEELADLGLQDILRGGKKLALDEIGIDSDINRINLNEYKSLLELARSRTKEFEAIEDEIFGLRTGKLEYS